MNPHSEELAPKTSASAIPPLPRAPCGAAQRGPASFYNTPALSVLSISPPGRGEPFTQLSHSAAMLYNDRKNETEEGFAVRILVVDDEARIRQLVAKYALHEGHQVKEAADGEEAVALCRAEHFDIIVLDIMMPGMDGFTACQQLRAFTDTPVLMLSARGEEFDRIRGFEVGADDYVCKPFSPKELMLRIAAIAKRAAGKPGGKKEIYTSGELTVDFTGRLVYVGGKPVDLSPKEYDLLFYMVKNRGIALSRERLITTVWGYDFLGDERTLDTHIKLLRRQLGGCAGLITTLRGVGYRFEDR